MYEEYRPERNTVSRLDSDIATGIYPVIRFYSNGYLNIFYIDRDDVSNPDDFNPSYNGKRGVYYRQGNQIRYDLYAEISQQRHLGLTTGTFVFSNDTLYEYTDHLKYYSIYVKRRLPSGYLDFKANW